MAACLQAHMPSFASQIKLHERFLDTAIAPLCKICHRRRPQIGFHLLSRSSSEDTARCSVCHQHGEVFTLANNNDPSPPPPSASRPLYCGPTQCLEWYKELCLKASLTEELLVTKFRTFLIMRRMPHQHLRYRGHTIAFVQVDQLLHSHSHTSRMLRICSPVGLASQDLDDFGQRLPRNFQSLPILIVRQQGQGPMQPYRLSSAHVDDR